MKVIIALVFAAVAVRALVVTPANVEDVFKFQNFIVQYTKDYQTTAEYDSAFHNFQQALKRTAGKKGYGITKFSDLSPQQFRERYLLPKGSIDISTLKQKFQAPVPVHKRAKAAPATCDWRNKNAVTPVKDQQQCGSCWAFSTTENFESMWFLGGNSIPTLAPQQLVDCDPQSQGCGGGWTYWAFEYLMTPGVGGQEGEVSYPYTAETGTCQFNAADVVAKLTNFTFATNPCESGSCPVQDTMLQSQLNAVGPLSICVNAGTWSDWTGPEPMAASDCPGDADDLDHCVQLVGYDWNQGYWIVRNSWNTDWGQQGYIYLQTGGNTCGLGDVVTYANVAASKHVKPRAMTCN
jgi:hypothetical protein